ncbi:MAG: GIY-YIG nuclease family protein [Chloroflexota bacterium]
MSVENQFQGVISKMSGLLDALCSSPGLTREALNDVPERGIYVLYEQNVPMYVGRSNRLKKRLHEHSRPSSGHTSATFAFLLAYKQGEKEGLRFESTTRSNIENDPQFSRIFLAAKERVSRMTIRVVPISDPIERTIFEVYAVLALSTTEYNKFENH